MTTFTRQYFQKLFDDISWQAVPALVARRYKAAAAIQGFYANRNYEGLWLPKQKHMLVKLAEDDNYIPLGNIDDLTISYVDELPDIDGILIKQGSSILTAPHELAGKMTNGPSPMSNTIVNGLLGAGMGYLGGHALGTLMPEDYVDSDALATRLAVLGGVAGGVTGLPQWLANMQLNQKATGETKPLRSFTEGANQQDVHPHTFDFQNYKPQEMRAGAWTIKAGSATGYDLLDVPIAVDRFNNTIWADSQTPPMVNAAATGLISGVQQMYNNSPLLTPKHFIYGLAAAGTDLATATVAGKTLGALGILKAPAVQQLQQMGVWGGMIRGVTSSVLGLN